MNVYEKDNRPVVLRGTATWHPAGPVEWRAGVPLWSELGYDVNDSLWPPAGHADVDRIGSAVLDEPSDPGRFVGLLEQCYKGEARAAYALAFGGATAAWMATLTALLVPGAPGREDTGAVREVIMSALTSGEAAAAAALCNLRPVVVDVQPSSGVVSVDAVAEAVTPSTRIVIAGPHHGWCPDMVALHRFCRKNGLWLVADASHAPFGIWEAEPWTECAHAVVTSLAPSMPWTAGAGGIVATDEPEIAELVAQLRDDDRRAVMIGGNARCTEMGAALALSRLEAFGSQQDVRELHLAQAEEMLRVADLSSVELFSSFGLNGAVGWAGFFNESDVPTGALRFALSRQLTVQVTSTMPPLSHPDSGFTAASVGERFAHLGIELDQAAFPNARAVYERAVVLPPAFWARVEGPQHLIRALTGFRDHEHELVAWAKSPA